MSYLVGGVVPGRLGNRHPTVVPYKTFDVADGVIIIAVGNDGQFRLLCDELGLDGLADDPRFARSRDRLANRDAIEAIVQDAVRTLAGKPLIERLTARGIPAGPVNNLDEVFADPFVAARGAVHRFRRADGVEIPSIAFPAKLSVTPVDMRRAPPRVGEGGQEALSDWLGLDPAACTALAATGAFG
jgi:crotonobetainyl-CoA:carnitine CoA-transferase CaiB-like acyl-CoA transferase